MSQISYTLEGVVSDGVVISDPMSSAYERGYISVVFYSDDYITSVLPTAGTLTFSASETGARFGTIQDGTVNVTTDEYDRPTFEGAVTHVKVTAKDITGNGALKYRVTINRFS